MRYKTKLRNVDIKKIIGKWVQYKDDKAIKRHMFNFH